MKLINKLILLFLFVFLSLSLKGQNKDIYVIMDIKYQDLFKFDENKHIDDDLYASSVKILKYKKRQRGFTQQENEVDDHHIVVVQKQPVVNNYYEFESYKKPEEILHIDHLELHSIIAISKNEKAIQEIWSTSKAIIFIEKTNDAYKLYKMKPIFSE